MTASVSEKGRYFTKEIIVRCYDVKFSAHLRSVGEKNHVVIISLAIDKMKFYPHARQMHWWMSPYELHFILFTLRGVVFVFCVQLSFNVFFIIWLLTACHAVANVSLWPSISVLGKPSSYFQSVFTEEGLKLQAPKDGSPLAILMDLSIDYMEIANVSFFIDHAEYLIIELITPAKAPQRVIIPILTYVFNNL